MAHWAHFEKQQEPYVRALVERLCGLSAEHVEETNYQRALQYAWSHFRYHRFLDVNSHSIQRTIDGLYEKFVINSDLKKADSWKRLTEKFLNLPLETVQGTKTDAHYSMLSLLLCLSDSPSNTNYHEKPREKETEKEAVFDWGKYLIEGEDIDLNFDEDTPEWSDVSEEEDPNEYLSREDSGIQVDGTPQEDQDQNKKATHVSWKVGEPDARSWLDQHVIPQYWTPRAPKVSHSLHLHSDLTNVWDLHLYNTSDALYTPDDRTFVTESQVIRETLWLLSGVKRMFIFQLNDGKVTVRDDIAMTHMTPPCLRSVLEPIAAYGQVVFRLQKFIDEVTGHGTESMLPGTLATAKKPTEAPFRTYQAFMWALCKYLITLKEELTDIEKCIINKDKTVTLSIVVDRLAPRFAELNVLHKVFSTGVAEVPPATSNVVKASHLLNTLYKAILEYDNVGEPSEHTVALLFSLWVDTVRPYLEIVDEWIIYGNLCDPAKEFIIQSNKDVPFNHRDFWYATYTLYGISEKTDSEDKMSDNASGSSGSDQTPSSRQHTMVSFLKPVLKHIIMAGKSMQLLKNLKCSADPLQQSSSRDSDRKSLHTLFLESVQFRLQHGKDSIPSIITEQQATKQSLIKMQCIVARHLEHNDVHDPLLAINFARLYLEQTDFLETFTSGDINVDRSSESVTCQTFQLTLRSCLYPHIEKQYVECCVNLMETLKKDYRLMEYMQAMRNFFLLESGDTMYDFYTPIFDRIRDKEPWHDAEFLNVLLQDAVMQRHLEDSQRLTLTLENVELVKMKPRHHILDGITLSYKVPWPVDIVISSESQRIYNNVFLLLLLIKLAKYSLDVLQFRDLVMAADQAEPQYKPLFESVDDSRIFIRKEPVHQQIHRMFILRAKLMHFVNSLHNYMMTRILHSTGLEFQHQVEEAKDLDELIHIHNKYLATINDRCLLREKVSAVKEAILKMMNVVLTFADRWHSGLGDWKMESIEKMEADFKNCHTFLVKVLNTAVCRGSFPHLESLALSLKAGM